MMPFANLMGLLASGTDSTAVLRCIQQVAMLVQGNWVVKRCETGLLTFSGFVNITQLIELCNQVSDANVLISPPTAMFCILKTPAALTAASRLRCSVVAETLW